VPPLRELAESEEGIVAHMNEDHADAVQLYAQKLLDLPGTGWTMTGIDTEGLDLRRKGAVGRLSFDAPMTAAAQARALLVALVAKARGA
jgi:putative heme iron utilization protein